MSSYGSNQLTYTTPFLILDIATLQAIVIAAMAALIAYKNSVDSSGEGNGVNNPNQGNNRRNPPTSDYLQESPEKQT